MECRACIEGSISHHGRCDLCGFDEMQFINEWDEWSESLEVDEDMESYENYLTLCESVQKSMEEAA